MFRLLLCHLLSWELGSGGSLKTLHPSLPSTTHHYLKKLKTYLQNLLSCPDSEKFCVYCREYFHSFGTTLIAFSAAFSGTAMGFSVSSYLDELCVVFQVVVVFCCLIKFDNV